MGQTGRGVLLAGHTALALVVAAALAVPLSLLLLWRYRRAVLAAMRRSARHDSAGTSPHDTASPAPSHAPHGHIEITVRDSAHPSACAGAAAQIVRGALLGPWRLALVYTIAALGQAIVIAAAWRLKSATPVVHAVTLVNTWIYFWPGLLIVGIALSGSVRTWAALVAAYLTAFLLLVGLAFADGGMALLMLGAWGQIVLPPTLVLLPFLHRRLRAVGPLVLAALLLASAGALAILKLAVDAAVGPGSAPDPEASYWIEVLALAAGFMLFGAAGWQAVGWLGRRYRAKRFGDQSLVLDLIALIFSLYQSAVLSGTLWALAGPVSFGVFKLLSVAGFALARRRDGDRSNVKLLLLRVFGNPRRSERLMTQVGVRWRHVGSIQLIAGTDLVTSTVTPHDFLEFAGGRLAQRYIADRQDLDRRLTSQDLAPDPDGRYRVNEFFCYSNTWQATVARVAVEADAVLMDLREFSAERQGCAFEIGALVQRVRLDKVVFIVNQSTDLTLLRATLERACAAITAESPNAAARTRVTLIRTDREGRANTRLLLASLATAATQAANNNTNRSSGHSGAPDAAPERHHGRTRRAHDHEQTGAQL